MALDPRTPVLVGVGQVTSRPEPGVAPPDRPCPARPHGGAPCGRPPRTAPGSRPATRRARGPDCWSASTACGSCAAWTWHPTNPALAVAGRLGVAPRGACSPPSAATCPRPSSTTPPAPSPGATSTSSLITGAEGMYARAVARRNRPAAPGSHGRAAADGTPPPGPLRRGDGRRASDLEMSTGVWSSRSRPTLLIENALRAAHGWTLDEHAARFGALWSRFCHVAAGQSRRLDPPTSSHGDEIVRPRPGQPHGLVPLSEAVHRQHAGRPGSRVHRVLGRRRPATAGVPEERWVFPLAGADAHDHWFLSSAPSCTAPPAIRLAGTAALEQAGARHRRRGVRSTSTRASPPSCRSRPPSSGWPSMARPAA